MNNTIKQQLEAWAEPDFQAFSARLLPNVHNLLGVRLPKLRTLARKLAKGDWRHYLTHACDDTFEEIMLQGMTIGYVQAEPDELFPYITHFLPKIDNWSTCDSFCSGLKLAKAYPNPFWDFTLPCLADTREFVVRFGVVMLLFYYLDDAHIDHVLSLLDSVQHNDYYVRMAVAWALSIAFIGYPNLTMAYLQQNTLDDFTYNKALQKIIESKQISPETKIQIRHMKRS